MRLKYWFRRWPTRIPSVAGDWTRLDQNTISDSILGTLSRRPNEQFFDLNIVLGSTDVPCWLHDGPQLDASLTFLRSVARSFPRLDHLYRKYAAIDLWEFRRALGKKQVSDNEFSARLRIQSIEIWFPASDPRIGANLWYNAGDMLGGVRACVVLDSQRRLWTIGVG